MERSYLPTPLGEISYIERKGGFPIIFLHGLGGSGNNWLKLAQYLPEDYRLLMPDLGGHGKTGVQMKDFSIAEQVELLKAFIEAKGIRDFALVGNSYGGWVSMRYCLAGGNPSFLVLVDSAGINPTVGEASKEGAERFVSRVMEMNPKNDPEIIGKFVRTNSTGREKLTEDELHSIKAKTLIIWGRSDRLIPVEYARKLHVSIGGSGIHILDDAGHIPHSTHPKEVADLLISFIELSHH